MSGETPDVIDLLVGITPGSALDQARAARSQARENAELSYRALFQPDDPGDFSVPDRHAVAHFVAGVHGQAEIATFYEAGMNPALSAIVGAEIARGTTQGPYGDYPAGILSTENVAGPRYQVLDSSQKILGARLAAALEHAHFLVFHPRDAAPAALQKLFDSGWSTTGIVTLSQLVAFLSFQIRVVTGLRALAAA